MDATREFTATFRAPEDPSDQDAIRRLRHTLKTMLRRYGWRCVECRPVTPTGANTSVGEAATRENTGKNGGAR